MSANGAQPSQRLRRAAFDEQTFRATGKGRTPKFTAPRVPKRDGQINTKSSIVRPG